MIKDDEFKKELEAERIALLQKAKEARLQTIKEPEKETYTEGQTVDDADLIALYKVGGVRKIHAITLKQFNEFTVKKPFKDCYSMQIYRTDLSKYAVLSW